VQLSSGSGGNALVSCFVLGNPKLPCGAAEINARVWASQWEVGTRRQACTEKRKRRVGARRPFLPPVVVEPIPDG